MISKDVKLAATFLKNDGVVGIPTETVYGLAGNAYSDVAINKIFEVKKRPNSNPLILHVKNSNELDKIGTQIPELAYKLAETFWPGPLTLIVKKQPHISNLITASQDTVAIRVPNHTLTLELLNSIDFPLVAPSANPFTRISPIEAPHVEAYFKDQINMVLDGGRCSEGVESTIVGFENNRAVIYRLGAISIEEIEKITNNVSVYKPLDKKIITPGMLKKHYSPNTDIILTRNVSQEIEWFSDKKIGLLLFNAPQPNFNLAYQKILSPDSNLKIATSNLYKALHELDAMNLDLIIAERFPEYGLGLTINDRLTRATKK
jgi:L-threonylcarbamoyladenylate synthase